MTAEISGIIQESCAFENKFIWVVFRVEFDGDVRFFVAPPKSTFLSMVFFSSFYSSFSEKEDSFSTFTHFAISWSCRSILFFWFVEELLKFLCLTALNISFLLAFIFIKISRIMYIPTNKHCFNKYNISTRHQKRVTQLKKLLDCIYHNPRRLTWVVC